MTFSLVESTKPKKMKKAKILVFAGSNSRNSINDKLAIWTANQLKDVDLNHIDLNDYEMPLYSIDRENTNGIHELAYKFKEQIKEADGVILSLAEHNSSYSVAFKNVYDWISRIEKLIWCEKPLLLMATAPGGRGGASVLDAAYSRWSRSEKDIIGPFSLPNFSANFDSNNGLIDPEKKAELFRLLEEFKNKINP